MTPGLGRSLAARCVTKSAKFAGMPPWACKGSTACRSDHTHPVMTRHPPSLGLPSKAEGPASEVYRIKDEPAACNGADGTRLYGTQAPAKATSGDVRSTRQTSIPRRRDRGLKQLFAI